VSLSYEGKVFVSECVKLASKLIGIKIRPQKFRVQAHFFPRTRAKAEKPSNNFNMLEMKLEFSLN